MSKIVGFERLLIVLALALPAPAVQDSAPQSQPASQAASQPASPLTLLDNFHAIEPGRAFRSAQLAPHKLEYVVRTHGIQTVINLRGPNPKHDWYNTQRAACERLGVTLIDIPLSARRMPSREHALQMFDAFRSAKGPILLHCASGADRSGLASAMWRMTMLDEAREDALRQLTFRYGHVAGRHPQMRRFISIYQPRREWLENEYVPLEAPASAPAEPEDDEP